VTLLEIALIGCLPTALGFYGVFIAGFGAGLGTTTTLGF